jgi:hypothetical protein
MMGFRWATWTKRRWYFVGFVAALIVWPAVVYVRGGNPANVIYLLTAVVVLAYTYETYCMRLEMIRQNDLVVKPLVLARIGLETVPGTSQIARQLILYNIGNGVALAVRVDDITFKEAPELTVRFLAEDIIRKDDQAICAADGLVGNQRFVSFVPALDPLSANTTYEVVIQYKDINDGPHYTVMRMGKEGIRLRRHGTGGP